MYDTDNERYDEIVVLNGGVVKCVDKFETEPNTHVTFPPHVYEQIVDHDGRSVSHLE